MISFDFEYYKPTTYDEAVSIYQNMNASGKSPLYYAGGTEIISMARMDQLRTGAVIDMKGIPECRVFQFHHNQLVIGAALTLNELAESPLFPLLADTVRDIADHTIRNKITIGGLLCGKFIYREGLLPFLLADSEVILAGPSGVRQIPIRQILNGEPRLEKGELLVQIITNANYLEMPYVTIKKTKLERIDYPIVRIAGLHTGEEIRMAFSGVSAIPFRSKKIEEILNDTSLSLEARVDIAIQWWPVPILNDILSSSAYRTFVLRNTLLDAMAALEQGRR
ncbi:MULTISPECIES: FAD binding domain-containing protein [Paenibacillus]|uniref:FAD binding domain-containing protein n=1 Tax=Paenibacillus violae TaxID=3077234 RepID=A0ABU3R882_9BACL|nr:MULTISPECIES: FAD binding domain-containing protein [Paenibacillus]MDU0200470.1 FAD binding domain-containing protein [Paenibacillus sp. PFR10]MEC0264634.1 FAD binding domain-containing protein [Paenibacillus anseongense]